jgi:hypothetical protein
LIEFEESEFVDATEAPDDFPVVWASCWEVEEYEPPAFHFKLIGDISRIRWNIQTLHSNVFVPPLCIASSYASCVINKFSYNLNANQACV